MRAWRRFQSAVAGGLIACAALANVDRAQPPAVAAAADSPTAATATALDPLVELNSAFRAAYAAHRADKLAAGGPVIIVSGDDLVLLAEGNRTQVRFSPDIYHVLKTYSHAPLAVHVMLVGQTDRPLDDAAIGELQDFVRLLGAAEEQIDKLPLADDERRAQRSLCEKSRQFVDEVIAARQVAGERLEQFTRDIGPELLANAERAARVQLDALDRQVQTWRRALCPEAWGQLRVIVEGSHTVRQGNLAVQYFDRLLATSEREHRVVFTEGIYEEPRALAVLGTVIVDTRIGASFFDDPQRMHRDLLADAAAKYLKSWPATR
ncbi:MAG: hypothetical protein K2Y37_14265 [Pirellulales bacterium]|nr:hypothetical protein [Pirellulales bacterium]